MMLDGKKIAEAICKNLKNFPTPKKFLAGILVGEDSASSGFLKKKFSAAKELGLDFRLYNFGPDILGDKLREEVGRIANQSVCGGVILQLPLPGQINAQYVLNAIPLTKDIDVLGERSLGAFYAGRSKILPPSVATAEEILRKSPIDLKESVVAVVGAGQLIGRPVANWLLGKAKEVIVLDKGSDYSLLKKADIIILGVGAPALIKGEMLKDGASVIDFGYAKNSDGKISGDLNLSSKLDHLNFYTPTPGGTGPILVAKIIENFYKLNSI
jgi:5,10-methylene-tetrahydrofolate dehydrogenase/methenyl tetrahydrofolate cyclohydrolase